MSIVSLADAIRQGCQATYPTRGKYLVDAFGNGYYAACALGAAAYALGIATRNEAVSEAIGRVYPELSAVTVACPQPYCDHQSTLQAIIEELNDKHFMSRPDIAAWLESLTLDLSPAPVALEVAA